MKEAWNTHHAEITIGVGRNRLIGNLYLPVANPPIGFMLCVNKVYGRSDKNHGPVVQCNNHGSALDRHNHIPVQLTTDVVA